MLTLARWFGKYTVSVVNRANSVKDQPTAASLSFSMDPFGIVLISMHDTSLNRASLNSWHSAMEKNLEVIILQTASYLDTPMELDTNEIWIL